MSLILEEFIKENIEEAIYFFKEDIFEYDVISNYEKIKLEYKSPTNYVADKTRGLYFDEVSESTLDFIICKCQRCPLDIRIQATKALLAKYYEKIKLRYDIETIKEKIFHLKEKIIEQIEQVSNDLSLGEDYDFDILPNTLFSEILYLIQIKIGGNYLKKIGFTTRNTIKPRVAEIKSSYKANSKKVFNISIKPIKICSVNNAKELEEKFIIEVQKRGAKFDTKYDFTGSSECLTGKYSKLADEVFMDIISKVNNIQIIFG